MRAQHLFLLVAAVAAGCSSPEGERVTLGEEGPRPGALPAEVQAPIDLGNASYRGGDYEAALQYYRTAAERAPEDVTPWIGVSMAAAALRNQPLKDSADARIGALAPDLLAGAQHGAPGGSVHP